MACVDKTRLAEYKAKRSAWIEWLAGKDRHSITNQIKQMVWDAAVFRAINEARRLAPADDEEGVQLNGVMHELINRGFFVSQVAAIRRLMDRTKGTTSLYRLLGDMERKAGLFTRKHMLEAEGLAYDFEPIREAEYRYAQKQTAAGKESRDGPELLDWYLPAERHKQIDRLAGVAEAQRKPTDAIRRKPLASLKTKLNVCDEILDYVDNFIAHAASHGRRAHVNADELKIVLGQLWDAHEAICKVVHFVSLYLLGTDIPSFLAAPQFNQFQYIDRPLVSPENIQYLHQEWQRYKKETHDWTLWGLDEFETEMV